MFLATLLRGLRARAMLSAGSVLLTAIAIGAALLGPMFADAVTASYAVSRLADEPNRATGLSVEFSPGSHLAQAPDEAARRVGTTVGRRNGPAFAEPSVQLESVRLPALTGEVLLEAKQGACARLDLDGRCPTEVGEALLSRYDARYLHVRPGDRLRLGRPVGSLTVTGVYRNAAQDEDFWFDTSRLQSQPALSHPRKPPTPYRPAPIFVVPAQFSALPPGSWIVRVDSRLQVRPSHALEDLASAQARAIEAGQPTEVDGGRLTGASSNSLTELSSLGAEIRSQQADARRSITPATISLILVALALLLRLLMAAADLRVPELAVASLRGTGQRRLWALGMAEPLALICVSLPAGLLFGYGTALALARSWLVPGLPVSTPAGALVAGALVVAAAIAVAALSVTRITRRPLADQLTGVRRPGAVPRSLLVFFLCCVALGGALLVGGLVGATSRQPDAGDFLLPAVLAAAAGIGMTWLVAWLAGRYADRRRRTRSMTGFLAARAISRRHEGTLVIVPITVALAVATFALGVDHAGASWRASAAATRAPAAQVWTSPLGLEETVALTHQLDPDGKWLMGGAASSFPEGLVSILDTERLARVAQWPRSWVSGRDALAVQDLLAPPTGVPVIAGGSVSITADNELDASGEVVLHLQLEDATGARSVDVGPFPSGLSTQTAPVPTCRRGCRLRTITIGRGAALPLPMHGRFTIRGLSANGEQRSAAGLGLRAGARAGSTGGATGSLSAGADGSVSVDIDTSGDGGTALLNTGGVRSEPPVLVGADAQWHTTTAPGGGRRLLLPDGPLDVRAAATAQSLPFFGPSGVLIDFAAFTARHVQFDQLTDVVVLASADTPPSVLQGLRGHRLVLDTTFAAERSALDNSAYALALRLYGVTAALVLLLALAGLALSTLVQLPARRRDAAALRVVGVRRRQVLGATARELAVVLGAAALAGVGAGLLAEVVVLRTLTLGYATELNTPVPTAGVDAVRLAVLVVITAAALGVAALAAAGATVRGARGSTLRESAR